MNNQRKQLLAALAITVGLPITVMADNRDCMTKKVWDNIPEYKYHCPETIEHY